MEGVLFLFDIVVIGGDGNLFYFVSGLFIGLSVELINGDIIGIIDVGVFVGGFNNDGIYNVIVLVDDSDGEMNDLVSISFIWIVFVFF